MGNHAKMRVAIITPYYKEPLDQLMKCIESVRAQTHAHCTHFMVADGHPRDDLPTNRFLLHMVLPRAHADFGDTPRTLGALSAVTLGFDAIAYLDADNWFYPNHVARMLQLARETNAAVVTATRDLYTREGAFIETDAYNDGVKFVDTSCFFLMRPAFRIIPHFMLMPLALAPVCDHVFFWAIRGHNLPRAHCPEPTVAYRTPWMDHYQRNNLPLPPDVKTPEGVRAAWNRWTTRPPEYIKAFGDYTTMGVWSADDPVSQVLGRRDD